MVSFFIIQEEWIEITPLDIYFLTRTPMLSIINDTMSKLTHGVSLEDVCDRNLYASSYVHLSYILV